MASGLPEPPPGFDLRTVLEAHGPPPERWVTTETAVYRKWRRGVAIEVCRASPHPAGLPEFPCADHLMFVDAVCSTPAPLPVEDLGSTSTADRLAPYPPV